MLSSESSKLQQLKGASAVPYAAMEALEKAAHICGHHLGHRKQVYG